MGGLSIDSMVLLEEDREPTAVAGMSAAAVGGAAALAGSEIGPYRLADLGPPAD